LYIVEPLSIDYNNNNICSNRQAGVAMGFDVFLTGFLVVVVEAHASVVFFTIIICLFFKAKLC
jgi:hypothetical protein